MTKKAKTLIQIVWPGVASIVASAMLFDPVHTILITKVAAILYLSLTPTIYDLLKEINE